MHDHDQMLKDLHTGNMSKYFKGDLDEKIVEQKLAMIKLTTGKIVANDPLCLFEFEPFLIEVEPGAYPVYLFLHCIEDDKRVAFAEIRFTDQKPIAFKPARREVEQEPDEEDAYLCYHVDSGTGGFMDASVANIVKEYDDKNGDRYFCDINILLEKSYVHTYDTADYTPRHADANVVVFSSGYGDGIYQSYLGYDETGKLCCLLTDFQTIDPLEDEYDEKPEIRPKKEGLLKRCASFILKK